MSYADTKATSGFCPCCTRVLSGYYPFVTARGVFCSRSCAEEDAEFPEFTRHPDDPTTGRWPRFINRLED